MGQYYVFYKSASLTKLVKIGVKRIDNYLLFKVNKEKHVAMITTEPDSFPVFLSVKQLYYVYESDTNTFDIQDGSVLSEKLQKSWSEYLSNHPEHRHRTALAKKPEDMERHHIIEDIQHIVLDGQFLKNLMSKIKGLSLMDWLFPFIAGMGASLFLLMILGSISPENVSIKIGKNI